MRVFAKYLLQSLPVLLVCYLLSFFFIRLIPGDPVMMILGERGADPAVYEALKEQLGVTRGFGEQLWSVMQLDFSRSIVTQQPVWSEFKLRFLATFELSIFALVTAVVLGLPLGCLTAVLSKGTWRPMDRLISSLSVFGYSVPLFWWALLLISFFSNHLGWLPVAGRSCPDFQVHTWSGLYLIDAWFSENPVLAFLNAFHHLLLPGLVLSTVPLASLVRMTRGSVIDQLNQDYVRTAKAKGVSRSRVLFQHVLSNAWVPILTTLGLILNSLLAGAVLTETVFAWPGLGRWMVQSVLSRDYPVVQACLVLISTGVVVINGLIESLLHTVDPKAGDN